MIRPASLLVAFLAALPLVYGQRITTIQLDGVQYFVSRMNPYSPELNYFLAYQYCRSLGLQLTSFESREKSDSITQYLRNAGYSNFDFWTSGNRLGTDMFLWMSTGLPFNATFDYINQPAAGATDNTAPIAPDTIMVGSEVHGPIPAAPPAPPAGMHRRPGSARQSKSGPSSGCVALKAPDLHWDVDDCTVAKDFICEQTRCYYYNYGSIPVSTSQGRGNRDRSVNLPRTTSKPTTERATTPTSTTSTTTTTTQVPVEPTFSSSPSPSASPSPSPSSSPSSSSSASASSLSNELPTSPESNEDASATENPTDDVTTSIPDDATGSTSKSFHVGMLPKGKVLEHDTARTPGITDLIRKWSFPAGIPLEIPVPRKVGGSSTVNAD